VFNPRKRPWVNMQGASSDKIIEIVNQCPTEALTWKWNEEEKNKQVTEAETNHIKFKRPDDTDLVGEEEVVQVEGTDPLKIRVMNDGPFLIEGNYLLTKSDGSKMYMQGITSLCRCGESDSMPFCDGAHRKKGFAG